MKEFTINKSFLANAAALVLVGGGLLSPWFANQLMSMGLFALSGGLTNWLAIYMLFERVPGLAGSGVIPNRFEEFKAAIRHLMMDQFFSSTHLRKWVEQEEAHIAHWFKPDSLVESLDYDSLYEKLVDAVMDTSFGGMLNALGGKRLLDSMKENIIEKIKASLSEMSHRPRFRQALVKCIDNEAILKDMKSRIEHVIDQRLQELTPKLVKKIIQDMIHKHLGWLVVWGVVFGTLLGLAASFIPS